LSVEAMQRAEQMLRTVELPRAVRGVDGEQARRLLDTAADHLAAAAREQSELLSELRRLHEVKDESAIGEAFLAATRAGDAVLAEAREAAASLVAEAEARAGTLLEQAKTQAEKREQETREAREQLEQELADIRTGHTKKLESVRAESETALEAARQELQRLENHAAHLRSVVADLERRIVEVAESALKELDALGAPATPAKSGDLLTTLHPVSRPANIAAG
jgi:cell division septum initiation protein DivIVA